MADTGKQSPLGHKRIRRSSYRIDVIQINSNAEDYFMGISKSNDLITHTAD